MKGDSYSATLYILHLEKAQNQLYSHPRHVGDNYSNSVTSPKETIIFIWQIFFSCCLRRLPKTSI